MAARRGAWLLVIGLACVMAGSKRVHACSCAGGGPACQATWQAAAVFVGQVVDIAPFVDATDAGAFGNDLRVRIKVTEVFRGSVESAADVYTSSSTASCGYEFNANRVYLIYAYRSRDRWRASHCSRTRPIEDAAADLAYLRGPARQMSGLGTVQGTILRADALPPNENGYRTEQPFVGGLVSIESVGRDPVQRFSTRSGADGTYGVRVPAGKYRATLSLPNTLYALGLGNAEVLDPRGCAVADFSVWSNGRIAGRVVDARGVPIPNLTIGAIETIAASEAAHTWPDSQDATSDASGQFEVSRLPPGTYQLGVLSGVVAEKATPTMVWLTAEADGPPTRVAMGLEQHTFVGDFVIPESLALSSFGGTVVNAKGEAVAGARVYLKMPIPGNSGGRIIARALTSRAGAFAFTARAGVEYRLVAEHYIAPRGMSAESALFRAATGMASFALRFDR